MTPILAQVYALRAQLDALVMTLEAAEGLSSPPAVAPGRCRNCGADADHQVDMSTLDGTKRTRCAVCGIEVTR